MDFFFYEQINEQLLRSLVFHFLFPPLFTITYPKVKQEILENKVYSCPGNVDVDKKLQQLLAPLALSDDQR